MYLVLYFGVFYIHYLSFPPEHYNPRWTYNLYLGVSTQACPPPCTSLYQEGIETIEPDRDEENKREQYKIPHAAVRLEEKCMPMCVRPRAISHGIHIAFGPRAAAPDRAMQGKAQGRDDRHFLGKLESRYINDGIFNSAMMRHLAAADSLPLRAARWRPLQLRSGYSSYVPCLPCQRLAARLPASTTNTASIPAHRHTGTPACPPNPGKY